MKEMLENHQQCQHSSHGTRQHRIYEKSKKQPIWIAVLQLQIVVPCVGKTLAYDRIRKGFASNNKNHPNVTDIFPQQQQLYNYTHYVLVIHPSKPSGCVRESVYTFGVALSTKHEDLVSNRSIVQ